MRHAEEETAIWNRRILLFFFFNHAKIETTPQVFLLKQTAKSSSGALESWNKVASQST